ncbi:hypothetical protein BD309DRAFT_656856 [Dichomitus squalens]|nr:hypothetical protein BD309DRAFT_656856 [Dichomitus squalens]
MSARLALHRPPPDDCVERGEGPTAQRMAHSRSRESPTTTSVRSGLRTRTEPGEEQSERRLASVLVATGPRQADNVTNEEVEARGSQMGRRSTGSGGRVASCCTGGIFCKMSAQTSIRLFSHNVVVLL